MNLILSCYKFDLMTSPESSTAVLFVSEREQGQRQGMKDETMMGSKLERKMRVDWSFCTTYLL